MTQERLQKVLASRGAASRRRAEGLIAAGRVTVNGQVAEIGLSVDPEFDEIQVDGRLLQASSHLYLALNKPVGYVSSLRSTHGEPTVADLVAVPSRVYPVGRLDKDTSGLLLLTNDGDWANGVLHPRYEVEKEYRVTVRGVPSPATIDSLQTGMPLPDGSVSAPARARVLQRHGSTAVLALTLIEGKKRQIRIMLVKVGHPVLLLERVRIGPIRLGALRIGATRPLTAREVENMREQAVVRPPASGP